MAESIIKDPVTGNQYSRDTSIAGSVYKPYTPPVAPASSPTVISNANVIDKKIPDIVNKANTTIAGATSGTTNNTQNTNDGSIESPYSYLGNYKSAYEGADTGDSTYNDELGILKSMQANTDAQTEAFIQSIKNNYAGLRTNLTDQQQQQTKQVENALNLAGSSRYAPVSSSGILSAKQKFDIQSLADLQDKENSAIATARQAQADKNYQLLSKQIDIINSHRQEKQALASKIADDMAQTHRDEIKRQQDIEDEQRKNMFEITAKAAEAGADEATMAKIRASKDPQEALAIATPYLAVAQKLDNDYKRAQIANVYSEIAKRKADSEGTGSSDPATIIAYAQQYASTGQIPTGLPKGTFGVVSEYAKELPKPTGAIVDVNTGIKSSKLSNQQEQGIVGIYDALQKIDQLQQVFNSGKAGLNFSKEYNTIKGEFVDSLARARSGAALTVDEVNNYNGKVPGVHLGGMVVWKPTSETAFNTLRNSLKQKLDAQLGNNGLAIYGYTSYKMDGKDYKVGQKIQFDDGSIGQVLPDGKVSVQSQ